MWHVSMHDARLVLFSPIYKSTRAAPWLCLQQAPVVSVRVLSLRTGSLTRRTSSDLDAGEGAPLLSMPANLSTEGVSRADTKAAFCRSVPYCLAW